MTKSEIDMTSIPSSLMVWTIHDPVIEDHALLEQQFHDIRAAGFGGVAAFVRCSRYTWDQPPAMAALRRIADLCRQYELRFWVGPDPRFISRSLIGTGLGLPVLLYGDQVKAQQVPHFAPIVKNRFSIRCAILPRPGHMFHEVAITFQPAGILKLYAGRANRINYNTQDVIDITHSASFFYHAWDQYVEAFGAFVPPDNDDWQVLAFFLLSSSHVDYTNSLQVRRYLERLKELSEKVDSIAALMWDEPGFTCIYGALPFSGRIQKDFQRQTGLALPENLWQLALDSADASHIGVRIAYFRSVQQALMRWQNRVRRFVPSCWGNNVLTGIHDTWHFESADMCDMNHGSMDLWRSLATKSGGFVDLGSVNLLRAPESEFYANLAAMGIIGRSLGRYSAGKFAVNNLWTVGDDAGAGWQTGVLNHCVNIMALFGQRWLAHCYGPAGTIGEEQSFLGSPPLPGYPQHSTWTGFPDWNTRLQEHFQATEGKLPWANLLVVFPVETLYALADFRANALASDIFRLLLTLMDRHYHVEVVSSALLASAKWRGKQLMVNENIYDGILLPHAEILTEKVWQRLQPGIDQVLFALAKPRFTETGASIAVPDGLCAFEMPRVLDWLQQRPELRPVRAPEHCWVSLTKFAEGVLITLAPARYGDEYGGEVGYQGRSFTIPKISGLIRTLVPEL